MKRSHYIIGGLALAMSMPVSYTHRRVSRRTLQEYRNNRVLPFILLGGKVLYPETGLPGVLEANYRKPLE